MPRSLARSLTATVASPPDTEIPTSDRPRSSTARAIACELPTELDVLDSSLLALVFRLIGRLPRDTTGAG
jgi:hypothetical protein